MGQSLSRLLLLHSNPHPKVSWSTLVQEGWEGPEMTYYYQRTEARKPPLKSRKSYREKSQKRGDERRSF